MKKNLIIGLLTIVSLLSISYSYFQKERADENELLANENERLAKEMRIKSEDQTKFMEQQMRQIEMMIKELTIQKERNEELAKGKGAK
jgi:Tfp pilus assembly protein PilO